MSERILFLGQALTEEEFGKVFDDWYNAKILDFKTKITQFLNNADSLNDIDFLKKWNEIQYECFGNDAVELMISWHTDKENERIFSTTLNEEKMMNPKTLDLSKNRAKQIVDEGKKAELASQIQDVLNEHYKNMIKQLQNWGTNSADAQRIHRALGSKNSPVRNRTANNYHYSSKNGGQGLYTIFTQQSQTDGKLMDGYMNHLAKFHTQIYDLTVPGVSSQKISGVLRQIKNNMHDFLTEVPVVQPVLQWAAEARNTTPWFRGGDIVIVDKNNTVIYNIQMKDTVSEQQKSPKRSELLGRLTKINKILNKTDEKELKEELINYLWRSFKISISNQDTNIINFINSKCYKLAMDKLTKIST